MLKAHAITGLQRVAVEKGDIITGMIATSPIRGRMKFIYKAKGERPYTMSRVENTNTLQFKPDFTGFTIDKDGVILSPNAVRLDVQLIREDDQ